MRPTTWILWLMAVVALFLSVVSGFWEPEDWTEAHDVYYQGRYWEPGEHERNINQ